MKKTQLSISITLAFTLAPSLLLIGCSSDGDSDKNVQGDASSLPDTPFNTMVKSELLFNPTVNGDAGQATQYLNGKLGTNGALTSEQTSALNDSIASAKAVDGDQPFKATAAVVDKVVMTQTYDVAVTAEEITAQKLVKKDLQLDTKKATWVESDHDEDPRGMVLLDGRNLAVIATDEHNSLIVVDTDSAEVKSQSLFAGVEGPRYTIDAETGASEHILRDIGAAADGQSVYVSVKPEKGDESVGNDQDDRYGLFRVLINDQGVPAAYNDPTSKRFISAYVGAFHITADGKVYMQDTDAEIIRILDADLNDTGSILNLPADVQADGVFFTDDSTMYIASKGDDKATPPVVAQLHKVDSQTGSVTGSMDIDVAPDGLVLFDNGKQALIYEEDLYAAILDLNNMKETRRLPLSEELDQIVQTATVTPDNRYAILSGHHNSEIWIFDLTLPVSRMEKLLPTDTVIRALGADANGGIYAAGRDGFVDVSKLIAGDVLSPKQAILSDTDFITEESLNHDVPLSVIVSDLSLYTEVPAGGGSNIEWATTSSSINTIESDDNPLGKVTRPQDADENSTLMANLKYSFRDISETGDKTFDTLVRLAPADLSVQGEPLASGKLPNGFVRHIDASPDGSKAVAGFHGKGGFNIITRGAGDAAQYALPTTDEEGVITHQVFPAPYTGQRPVGVQFLDDDTVMIAVSEGEDADGNKSGGALLIYGTGSAEISGGGAAPLKKTLVQSGKIQSVSHKVNGKVAVVVASDSGRKAVIIDASDPNESNPEIALSPTAGAIALSADAQAVFVVEEDGISKYSGASGTKVAHVEKTDDFKPRSIVMSEGIVYVGTEDGKLFRFNVADLTSAGDSFTTGYGSGVRTIDVVDGKAYMSIKGFGVTVADPVARKEIAFFAHEKQRHAGVSDDGSYIFASQYLGRPASEIVVLKVVN